MIVLYGLVSSLSRLTFSSATTDQCSIVYVCSPGLHWHTYLVSQSPRGWCQRTMHLTQCWIGHQTTTPVPSSAGASDLSESSRRVHPLLYHYSDQSQRSWPFPCCPGRYCDRLDHHAPPPDWQGIPEREECQNKCIKVGAGFSLLAV